MAPVVDLWAMAAYWVGLTVDEEAIAVRAVDPRVGTEAFAVREEAKAVREAMVGSQTRSRGRGAGTVVATAPLEALVARGVGVD